MAEMKEQVDKEFENYKSINSDLQELMFKRQQFYSSANENGMVAQELDLLADDAQVFKMLGPVLIKQDLAEAKDNVTKRLDFIQDQMKNCQEAIEGKQKQQAEVVEKIQKMQQAMQATAAAEAQKTYAEIANSAADEDS
ncbi:unnamed protein product [Heterosigma akashiwo]|uniref:Prefoldin subunit 6 n=1 Tax=Heterosigma akashiwo TaxID=2829 RepID=A0A6V1PDA7_HETAK|mmetsp:Transcript_14817/g.20439  ORF Transcript_14817/g.20439 Transcript_14817/m.20439 type:complete len:139 (-) Transcript_14817:230-646(-)